MVIEIDLKRFVRDADKNQRELMRRKGALIRRRIKHRQANARYKKNLSPEKREAMLKRDREYQQRRRDSAKAMAAVSSVEVNEHDDKSKSIHSDAAAERKPKHKEEEISASGVTLDFLEAQDNTTRWWQNDDTINYKKYYSSPHRLANAYKCSRCNKTFLNEVDANAHEFGVYGNAGSKKHAKLLWIELPCQGGAKSEGKWKRTIGQSYADAKEAKEFPSREELERRKRSDYQCYNFVELGCTLGRLKREHCIKHDEELLSFYCYMNANHVPGDSILADVRYTEGYEGEFGDTTL